MSSSPTESRDPESFVRALARGLSVIEALGRSPGRHTMAEVAAQADLNRATARRILMTLVELGYCQNDGRYFRLTPRALGLGISYLSALPFWGYAQQVLDELRTEIGESCAMAVLDGTEIVYLLRLPARRILAAPLAVGSRLPARVVSLGRVLLAALPPAALDDYFRQIELTSLTPRTIVDPDALRRELQAVSERGYAWVDGELDPAICGIAVPVRDGQGAVVAAISVNAIAGSIDEEGARQRFLVPLRRAAAEISSRSGL